MSAGHTVVFEWDGEDLYPIVSCHYAPDDPERPCQAFDDYEAEHPSKPIPGCAVEDWISAAGWQEGVQTEGIIRSAPVAIELAGGWGDESPTIRVAAASSGRDLRAEGSEDHQGAEFEQSTNRPWETAE